MHIALGLVALFAGVIASPNAFALDPTRTLTQALHRIWQMQQGLPQATIYRIRQTSDGYLWLATQTGLVRFDGVRFVDINGPRALLLKDAWIHDLIEDRHHDLWLATDDRGVLRWHDGEFTAFGCAAGLPSATTRALRVDTHGTLWVATAAGLASFDGTRFKSFAIAEGLASIDIKAICLLPDGSLCAGGAGNVLSVGGAGGFHPLTLKTLSPGASIHALLSNPDGTLTIGSTVGLIQLKGGVERRWTASEGLADNNVFCLETSRDNGLWVGTQNGFSRMRGTDVESFRSQDGLSQSTVFTLCEDQEGSLWAGTKHGLDQFLDRRTVPFTVSEGLPSNDTGPVLQGPDGGMWVGTIGAGLSRFDGHRFSVCAKAQGLANDSIRALASDDAGNLWVGSDGGVNQLKGGAVAHTFATEQGLPANVRTLAVDKAHDLWIGALHGAALLHDGAITKVTDDPVRALFCRADGSVLASTGEGALSIYRDGTLKPLATSPAVTRASCFFEDAQGLLWIGTRGDGLALLRGSDLFTFHVRDGLYDDDLFGIVADDVGRLWFACSKGIFSVNRAELLDFAAGKAKTVVSNPFSPTDALRTIECKSDVQPAACRTRDGSLWFSTIHGAIVIDPAHLTRKLPPPPVTIEEVIVDGQTGRPAEVQSLEPGSHNLEFGYTALSFLRPGGTTFRYKLEGFDKDWVDAGIRREAFYTNLPPGRFRFRVMASLVDGSSAEAANVVAFRVQPHLYQRAVFVPMLVLIAASIVSLIYWRRVRIIHAQAQAVLNERSRIARELHDTLMQGFSGVTMEMQALAGRLPESTERQTLAEIIADAGVCLREARQSVAGIRTGGPTTTGLAGAVAAAARQATDGRDVKLKLSIRPLTAALQPEVEFNLVRITQEAVTNAVKHAACRTIEVTMTADLHALTLSVRDDGAGITASASPGHYGLVGMRERADGIRASLQIESQPRTGTCVKVIYPFPSSRPEPSPAELRPRLT